MPRIVRYFLLATGALAFTVPAAAQETPPTDFDQVEWQSAEPADIHVMDPYIGTFRSETRSRNDGTEFYFTVSYAWYDAGQTLVKTTIRMVIPETGEERLIGDGFYGYDAFAGRIFSHVFFSRGTAAHGWISDFDPGPSLRRVVRLRSRDQDNVTTEVRDTFWLIDEDRWINETFLSVDGGPWRKISSGVYTRVES